MTPLSRLTIFSYGMLALPLSMLGLPLYIYLPTYYTGTLGLEMGYVGAVLMIARALDMVCDPLIGLFNDRYYRRAQKGFLLIGTAILLVSFYVLINPLKGMEKLSLFLFSLSAYIGWSMMSIPYLTHSAHLSPITHDKTRLSAMRELFAITGGIIAILLPYAMSVSADPAQSLPLLYIAFALTLLIALPFTLSTFSKNTSTDAAIPIELKEILHQSDKRLLGSFFINSLANALPVTLFLIFVDSYLNEADSTGLLLILYFISGIVALPFWIHLSQKTGKRRAWMASMMIASGAFAFVPFIGSGDLDWFILICIISGTSLGADMALPASIQADIAEKSKGASGSLFGLWAMITKLSLALAVGIGFVVLDWAGFDAAAPDSDGLLALSLLYGTAPVVLKSIAFVIMRGYRESV